MFAKAAKLNNQKIRNNENDFIKTLNTKEMDWKTDIYNYKNYTVKQDADGGYQVSFKTKPTQPETEVGKLVKEVVDEYLGVDAQASKTMENGMTKEAILLGIVFGAYQMYNKLNNVKPQKTLQETLRMLKSLVRQNDTFFFYDKVRKCGEHVQMFDGNGIFSIKCDDCKTDCEWFYARSKKPVGKKTTNGLKVYSDMIDEWKKALTENEICVIDGSVLTEMRKIAENEKYTSNVVELFGRYFTMENIRNVCRFFEFSNYPDVRIMDFDYCDKEKPLPKNISKSYPRFKKFEPLLFEAVDGSSWAIIICYNGYDPEYQLKQKERKPLNNIPVFDKVNNLAK